MKDFLVKPSDTERTPAAVSHPVAEVAPADTSALAAQIHGSPRLTAQRRQIQGLRPSSGTEGPSTATAPRDGLPAQLRSGIEALSGVDLSDVRVHTNSSKPAQLNALAYAQGSQIHLGPGQERHLAHEAWHVVQQRQGRVVPTTTVGGAHVNDDARLEAEADRMGGIAQRVRADTAVTGGYRGTGGAADVAQLRTQVDYESQNINYPGGGGVRAEKIGKTMDAYLDPADPIRGSPTDATEIDGLMTYLGEAYPAGTRGWHRGHLLNAKLGGLNIPSNLAPFTNAMNTGAHSIIEDAVKRLVGIGVPTRYVVTYSLAVSPQAVTPTLTMEVVPDPIDDQQQEDLDLREIPPTQKYTITARTLRHNIDRRPRSPQPAHLGLGDGTLVIPLQDGYSSYQDKRIRAKGWGMLEREQRSRRTGNVKMVGASLNAEDRQRVEQQIEDDGGSLFASTAIGTATYNTDFWLRYAWAGHVYTRSNLDVVSDVANRATGIHEYVTVGANNLVKQRHGPNQPSRFEGLEHIYTRANRNQVWRSHDGVDNVEVYLTLDPGGTNVLNDHRQVLPDRYEYHQLYTRQNGDQVWHTHDGQQDTDGYVTTDPAGQQVLQDHGQVEPPRYDLTQQHYTRSNGNQVWESHDGANNAVAYVTTDGGGNNVLENHGPHLPVRYELHIVYTRRNGDRVQFVHDGVTNIGSYATTDANGSNILQHHGQVEPARYDLIQQVYTRPNGNQIWHSHDGEQNVMVYVRIDSITNQLLEDLGQNLPSRYESVQLIYTRRNGDQVWNSHDGEQNINVYLTANTAGNVSQVHGQNLPYRYELIQLLQDFGDGTGFWTAHDGSSNQIVQDQF